MSHCSVFLLTHLPRELIAYIFRLAILSPPTPGQPHKPLGTLHTLLLTSSLLRAIVLSIPHLFTRFTLVLQPDSHLDDQDNIDFIRSFFGHSGMSLPLRLCIDATASTNLAANFSAVRFFEQIILHPAWRERWEVLDMRVPLHTTFQPLLNSLCVDLWPRLHALRLEAAGEDFSLSSPEGANSFLSNNRTAPNLSHLGMSLRTTVKIVAPSVSTHAPSLCHFKMFSPWTQLKSLEMDTYTTTSEMFILLAQTPNIESCDIRLHADMLDPFPPIMPHMSVWPLASSSSSSPISASTIFLQHLRRLTIRTTPHLAILAHLCAPMLHGLHIEMPYDNGDSDGDSMRSEIPFIAAFLSSSCQGNTMHPLTHLKLVSLPLDDEGLVNILRYTPKLREMRVWWGPDGRFLDDMIYVHSLEKNDFSEPEYENGYTNEYAMDFEVSEFTNAGLLIPVLEHLELYLSPQKVVPDLEEKLHDVASYRSRMSGRAPPLVMSVWLREKDCNSDFRWLEREIGEDEDGLYF